MILNLAVTLLRRKWCKSVYPTGRKVNVGRLNLEKNTVKAKDKAHFQLNIVSIACKVIIW